jgi:hypothetical protein
MKTLSESQNIVFDFSSSPSGGGRVRALAFLKYFKNSGNALFLLHPHLRSEVNPEELKCSVRFISKSFFGKILNLSVYKKAAVRDFPDLKVWFSYGIPLFKRYAPVQILHISNALTLTTRGVSVGIADYFKFYLLLQYFIRSRKQVDLWTGESRFVGEILRNAMGPVNYKVWQNGLDEVNVDTNYDGRADFGEYALAIGTYSYKRIDRSYEWFKRNGARFGAKRLVIIGAIPKKKIKDEDILYLGERSPPQVRALLMQCCFYISSSEIENSSNALMEALILSRNVVVSDIQSHREILEDLIKSPLKKLDGMICASRVEERKKKFMTWSDCISHFLTTTALPATAYTQERLIS